MNSQARRILLVDDDPLVIKVYAERMRFEGWAVAVARDGWEACQESRRTRFDMILLDIRMPYHDGVAVLKEIREGDSNSETPVYILTSLTQGDDVDDALRLGADGVFYKTQTRPDELVNEVESILSSAGAQPSMSPRREPAAVAAGAGSPKSDSLVEALESTPSQLRPSGGAPAREPELEPEPEPEQENLPALEGDFQVYVNPFLGDGEALSRGLGLTAPYQCPSCGGQVCLRLSPDPQGNGHEVTGYFLCSRCGEEV